MPWMLGKLNKTLCLGECAFKRDNKGIRMIFNQTQLEENSVAPTFSFLKPGLLGRPKVLLIEDDRTIRRMVRAEISEYCDLSFAGNASLGVSLYKKTRPDIVFIDISLPDGSGHDLLQWVLKANRNAFAVMFSGHSDHGNIWRSIDSGAKGFVAKPFDANKMLFFINKCMNK